MQVHRDHDRHPLGIKRAAIDHRPDNRDHDVDDLKEIQHKPQHKQHQHHDQEHRQLIVERLQELLDIVFPTKADHHQVQQLRPDQDGEHHRGHFGGFAHNRGQNTRGVQDPAAEQQTEHRIEIGTIRHKEGKPAFKAHPFLIDTQVKVDADQNRDDDCQGGPDDHLGASVLVLQLAIGSQHDRATCPQRRCRCGVGDATQNRAQHRDDQYQRRKDHADQFILGTEPCGIDHTIEDHRKRDQHDHHHGPCGTERPNQRDVHKHRQHHTDATDNQWPRIRGRRHTARRGQEQ